MRMTAVIEDRPIDEIAAPLCYLLRRKGQWDRQSDTDQ
jgi:hypothetical protein